MTNGNTQVVYGVDFTSAPTSRKPITCASGEIDHSQLTISFIETWPSFAGFEALLHRSGVWVAGFDFPFGLPEKFLRNLDWPLRWQDYVGHIQSKGKQAFEAALNDYRRGRAAGDREHLRETDTIVRAISPQKLYGVPVAKMFFEGAGRLCDAPINVWPLRNEKHNATVIEAYPGYLVRQLIGRVSYKHDGNVTDATERRLNREHIVEALTAVKPAERFGFEIHLQATLRDRCVDDHRGDVLDAVLAAVHAARWLREPPQDEPITDSAIITEGWIPSLTT